MDRQLAVLVRNMTEVHLAEEQFKEIGVSWMNNSRMDLIYYYMVDSMQHHFILLSEFHDTRDLYWIDPPEIYSGNLNLCAEQENIEIVEFSVHYRMTRYGEYILYAPSPKNIQSEEIKVV